MGFKEFWKYATTNKSKKSAAEINIHHSTAKRKLSQTVILFILINSILGSSLFYLPGLGVISSGAASIIAWIALFIIASLVMLYIGELVTLHPTSGGTYEFCKRAYGRFGSFIAGWMIWIAGNFGMALGLIAAAQYFIPGTSMQTFVTQIIFVLIWILVLNFMAYRGINVGVSMLVVFGIIATIVVTAMTLPSFIDIPALFQGQFKGIYDFRLLQPFFQHEGISIFSYLALSLLLISEAFLGFETVTYLANETKEPKNLHKTIIKAIVLCGLIMTVYLFSSLGTVSYHDYVTDSRPFAVQALNTMGSVGETIVVFGMYLVIIGAVAAWPITGARLIRAMAHDKLFPKHFAVLHKKHKSPHRAVYFQTIAVLIFSWILFRGYIVGWDNPYRTVYLIYVLISLIVLSMILLTVPILRKKEANLKRPFTAPLGRAGPILFTLLFLFLIINWIKIEGGTAWSIIRLAGSFILLGLPFYFLVEMFYNPKAILWVNEILSYFILVGEKIFFPFSIRASLFNELKNIKGKKVLEFGCSVGTLTKKLARAVTVKGKVFAADLSLHKTRITDRRTKKFDQVTVHHHPHLHDFKLKLNPKVDHVISVGMLSYMQNPKKLLSSLAKQVKKNAEIIFIDFDKFFFFLPNVKWVENDRQLEKIFREAGFSVTVYRKNSLLWQYIIVKGRKR